jgi:hyperosmotically inducible periplasmic protein
LHANAAVQAARVPMITRNALLRRVIVTTGDGMVRHWTVSRKLWGIMAAFALVSLVACTRENAEQAAQTVENVTEKAERRLERAAAVFDDATVTAKVKTALLSEPQLKSLAIDVDTAKNVVSLNGTVESEQARADAERIARQVDGVKEVKNNLQVKKAS